MTEREYQVVHIDQLVQEVSTKRKVLGQLPTGGGKTVEFALITQRYIRNTDKAVLILVHREELMYQAARTIESVTGIKPYLITAKTTKFHVSRVYIGMVESTKSRLNLFHNVGLVIIDECHVANFNKVHSMFLEELIIGFSATPKAASKKEPLNKYYRSIVTGPQIGQLIGMGYLAQNITRCPKNIVDATQFDIDKLKGEYNEGQMAMEYSKPKHIMNLLNVYLRFCRGKKTIVFNVNIQHSKEVTSTLEMAGFNVKHLDGNTPDDERKAIIEWFKVTPDAILCNVAIATMGFDEPTVESVILNYSTLSIVKYIQCAGRGGRIVDDFFIEKHQHAYPYPLRHKSHFDLIDMGGNCIRFGDWNDNRDWEDMFYNPEKPGEGGVAPVKICPMCEGILHAAARVCTLHNDKGEFCGHSFEKKPQKEEDLGEMLIITKDINLEELISKNDHKFDYYLFFKLGENVVKQIFNESNVPTRKQLDDGFETYYKLCIEWWKASMAGQDGNVDDITNSAWHIKRAKNHFDKLVGEQQLAFNF